jgi:hypothetical protein
MAFITLPYINKIVFYNDIQSLNLTGEIYKTPIYLHKKEIWLFLYLMTAALFLNKGLSLKKIKNG